MSRLNEEYLEALEERRVQKLKRDIARAERIAWKKRIREEKLRTQEQPKLRPPKNHGASSERSDKTKAVSGSKTSTPVTSPIKSSTKSSKKQSISSDKPVLAELVTTDVDDEDEEKEEEEEPLLPPYPVPPELRLLPDERELAGMVGWMGLVQKTDEFW